MINDYEFEELQTKATKLRQEFDELAIKFQEHAPNRSLNPAYPHGQPMFAFREIHGPLRQDIDNTHTVTFYVDYDTFISKLYNAKLKVRFHNIRANVTGSAGGGGTTETSTDGGGQTSSSAGGQTSSSSGGQTSSGGSNHTHSITGLATGAPSGSGISVWAGPGTIGTGTSTNTPSPVSTQAESAAGDPHTHSLNDHKHEAISTTSVAADDHTHSIGGASTLGDTAHTHTVANHSHTVTNHDHTVTNHNHDVVLSSHSHSLTYGIFEQAYSNPGLSISINGVDRTAALGGPWNASPGTLDITQYLRETSDDPIRGEIPIVFSVASSLLNIEATLKSMVFSADLLAAGGV